MGFTCSATGYLLWQPTGQSTSRLTSVNLVTGTTATINPDIGVYINAIGYSTIDNLIYGMQAPTSNVLLSVDETGAVINHGAIPNLPSANYNTGAMDGNGHLYIYFTGQSRFYVVDVNPVSPTFSQLVDQNNGYTLDTAPYGTALSTPVATGDWTFNSVDGMLYGGITNQNDVFRVDPFTGQVTILTTTGLPVGAFGAGFSVNDPYVYLMNNNTGSIYRITISGNNAQAQLFGSTNLPTVGNDGAACLGASLALDYGDAPDTNPATQGIDNYRTLLASDGPRHLIVPDLTLGTQVTGEEDAYESADALGDDLLQGIQDDGVTLPLIPLTTSSTSYTLPVQVYNNTGQVANVYGWIDFNKNGVFQTNESAVATVPSSGAGLQTVNLVFTVPGGVTLTTGHTFVRVRLTTENLVNTGGATAEDTRSYGPAADGEVEDYELLIIDIQIDSTKVVDKAVADLGEILTYTVTLTNAGSSPVSNIIFTDALPAGTIYVGNLTVDKAYTGTTPMAGLTITSLAAGETATISWQVQIDNQIPVPNPIANIGQISGAGIQTMNTPIANTQVNHAELTVVKAGSSNYVGLGESLTYTLTLTNTGSVAADQIVVTDSLPSGMTFVPDSVTVGGVAVPGADPAVGILVGSIPANGIVVVSFTGIVSSTFPVPNPMQNTGEVDYQYTVDPGNPPVIVPTQLSNTLSTQVNQAILVLSKASNPLAAGFGDTVTYTTTFNNLGNVAAQNIFFTDSIPSGMSFVSGSVMIDGVATPLADPAVGFTVSDVAPGGSRTVSFQVTIDNGFPAQNPIPNTSGATYQYLVDPLGAPVNAVPVGSNQSLTQVNDTLLVATKTATPSIVDVGDTITYTVIIENQGNITSTNASFQDILPAGVTLVPNSVRIGGIIQPGYNPELGFNLPSIPAATNRIVTFDVTVDGVLPIPNTAVNTATVSEPGKTDVLSNPVTTTINHAQISVVKQANSQYVDLSDTITYTLTLTNVGNTVANQVVVTDTPPVGTSFVPGSVIVEGVSQPAASPLTGIAIGSMLAGEVVVVSFEAHVQDNLPIATTLTNRGEVDYSYVVDPINPPVIAPTSQSNPVDVDVHTARIQSIKVANKLQADLGEEITYTITLTNGGTVDATNVNFVDIIPSGTTLVNNSVTLDGVIQPGANPSVGVPVGTILPGASRVISFRVLVGNTIPVVNPLPNQSTTSYQYLVDPLGGIVNAVPSQSNQTLTEIKHANLSIQKTVNTLVATLGDTLTYTLVVTNQGNVAAEQVILTDNVPVGATFVAGTVQIDGVVDPIADPVAGLTIASIPAGTSITVTFDVVIGIVLPIPNPMINQASAAYEYTVDPANPPVNAPIQNSNTVPTLVIEQGDFASFNFIKTSDRSVATFGELVTYTLTLTNTGNTAGLNVVVKDVLEAGTTFVPNSISVDGLPVSGDIEVGLTILSIAPGQSVAISFEVTVDNTLPTINPVLNDALLDYEFRTDPDLDPISGPTSISNQTSLLVKEVRLVSQKSVNHSITDVNGHLIYTVSLANLGTVIAQGIILEDIMPQGTSFIPGTVVINGVVDALANPEVGIALPDSHPSDLFIISYEVLVGSQLPPINPLANDVTIQYNYQLEPLGPILPGTPLTPPSALTQVNHGAVNLVKVANKEYADLGEVIEYTITATNTGNISVSNCIVTDNIPAGTSFVPGSVVVGGSNQPLANPQVGITIPLLGAGQSVTITFSVSVDTVLPVVNPVLNEANSTYDYQVEPNGPITSAVGNPSNTESVQINHGELLIVKTQNVDYVDLGDEVTYQLVISNTGNVVTQSILLTDQMPEGMSFVAGSLSIGGIPVVDPNITPDTGIQLLDIVPGGSITVVFRALVESIPTTNPVPNEAQVQYMYLVNPSGLPVLANRVSNEVFVQVNHATLEGVKLADKQNVGVNGIINYTMSLTNTGSVLAENIVWNDTMPEGTTFVAGSVVVDSLPQPLADPQIGVGVGQLLPGASVLITFKVQVNGTIPNTNPIVNSAEFEYEYFVAPTDLLPHTGTGEVTQQIGTMVKLAQLDSLKEATPLVADLGEEVTYTITLTNTGNEVAQQVTLVDAIPSGMRFVAGSIVIGGIPYPELDLQGALDIPDIAPGASIIISFKVRVDETMPVSNPIINTSLAQFQYLIDPTDPPVTGVPSASNLSAVTVNSGQLVIEKQVNREFADLGDRLIMTFILTNIGNMPSQQVVLTDSLEPAFIFVQNSVTIDGVNQIGADPNSGIVIGTILAGTVVSVTFEVEVGSLPIGSTTVTNKGTIQYGYVVDPNEPLVSVEEDSNRVEVEVLHAEIGVAKQVNKQETTEGDILTYIITLTNTGNTIANPVMLQDSVPTGTTFIPHTVIIDGVSDVNADPGVGISLNPIAPGRSHTIIFKVKVNENAPNIISNIADVSYSYVVDPAQEPVDVVSSSNEVSVANITPRVEILKTSSKDIAAIGDIITYTIEVRNIGVIAIEDIIIKDLLEENLDFVEGTVKVNGYLLPHANILTGVSLGGLGINATKTISFDAKIIAQTDGWVENQSTADLFFKLNEEDHMRIKQVFSNINRILVQRPMLLIGKEADKSSVKLGDMISYHVTLLNSGDVDLLGVIFKDELSEAVTLIPGSFRVNNTIVNDPNLLEGVNVGGMVVGAQIDIYYQVKVISGTCNGWIQNEASAQYEYVLEDQTTGTQTTDKVVVRIPVAIANFKQMAMNTTVEIPAQKPDVEEIDDLTAQVKILDSYVVKTLSGTSREGQKLSGFKLMIHGELYISLEYTADVREQSMHSAHFTVPFTNFIILPIDYREGDQVEVSGIVEDVEGQMLDERMLDIYTMLLLVAKVVM